MKLNLQVFSDVSVRGNKSVRLLEGIAKDDCFFLRRITK